MISSEDLKNATLYGVDGEAFARLFGQSPGKWEKIIYYRNPEVSVDGEPLELAGWIRWDANDSLKRADRISLGYMPLPEFGFIRDSRNPWDAILSHPDGPKQFPLDQITAMKWYDERELRRQWPNMPRRMTPGRLFPQLRGATIEEFGCPNCRNRVFHDPGRLFSHMNITHSLAPADIFAWGERMNIPFEQKVKDRAVRRLQFEDYEDEPEPAPEPEPFVVVARSGRGTPVPRRTDRQPIPLPEEETE